MNSAYRYDPPKPEIHWHLIPRYRHEIEFEGLKFTDPDFGYIPQPVEHKLPQTIMKKIVEIIKNNLEEPP